MGKHLVAQHRRASAAQQPHPGQRQVAGGCVKQAQGGDVINQRRAQVLLQHQHQQAKQGKPQPGPEAAVAHVPAEHQQQGDFHHLAGLQRGAANANPVGGAVLLGADGQGQGNQRRRAKHDHFD